MPPSPLPTISDAEFEVLRVLWDTGPARVRDVRAALPEGRWAFTTVQTLLHRLRDKGYVARQEGEGVAVYEARIDREALLRHRAVDLADELADGSVVSVMHGLVSGKSLSRTEIADLRALLDELEDAPRRAGKRKATKSGARRSS